MARPGYTGGGMFSTHVFRVFAANVLQMDTESLGLRATVLWTADSFTCRGLQAGGSLYHLFSPLLSDARHQSSLEIFSTDSVSITSLHVCVCVCVLENNPQALLFLYNHMALM